MCDIPLVSNSKANYSNIVFMTENTDVIIDSGGSFLYMQSYR